VLLHKKDELLNGKFVLFLVFEPPQLNVSENYEEYVINKPTSVPRTNEKSSQPPI
jgi:hypothetical protein